MSYRITDHGSICVLTPLDPECAQWLSDHIAEDAQWFGRGVVIEPRYLSDIVQGLQDAGGEPE